MKTRVRVDAHPCQKKDGTFPCQRRWHPKEDGIFPCETRMVSFHVKEGWYLSISNKDGTQRRMVPFHVKQGWYLKKDGTYLCQRRMIPIHVKIRMISIIAVISIPIQV